MIIVDLFAGFGGFSLAGHWLGWETLMFCENASYPKKVLKKNFPGIAIHDDINNLTKEIIEKEFIRKYGYYDPDELIFTAGVPCQPASQAGKREGTKDHRWLWDPTLRIVREVKPSYAVFENVPGLLNLEDGKPFEEILNALESYGYEVESFVIPACSVGAWHRRYRVWIIAHSNINSKSNVSVNERPRQRKLGKNVTDTDTGFSNGQEEKIQTRGDASNIGIKNVTDNNKFNDDNSGSGTGKISQFKTSRIFKNTPDTQKQGLEGANAKGDTPARGRNLQFLGRDWWTVEPELGRVAHGISDRVERIKGLGNAIVPQLVFEIFKAIDYDTKNQEHSKHCL